MFPLPLSLDRKIFVVPTEGRGGEGGRVEEEEG